MARQRRKGSSSTIEPLYADILIGTKRFIESEARHKGVTIAVVVDILMEELQRHRQVIAKRDSTC
jgi:hypothetical protein